MTAVALLVVNARSRHGADMAEAAAGALVGAGISVLRRECSDAAGLDAVIREAAAVVDRVVIGGGDGTLSAAAPGLLATGLPLGIIPLGTANDLARTLGIPNDLNRAVAVIASGQVQRIDLGEVNGHPFFNVASIGFGVDLTRALTRDAKRRWGALGYAIAGLRALGRLKPFTVEIIEGGVTRYSRTVHVAVGNGRHYGGGMTVTEDARIDDGQLDLYSLEVESWWEMLRLAPALRSGRHRGLAKIRTHSGGAIEIRASRPRSVNADGEITTKTPAYFRVLPGALRVYVPS